MAELQSGDPRWVNPLIMQNQQYQQQMGGVEQEQQASEEQPQDNKLEEVRKAMILVKQMKEKGPGNRSQREQSAYKAAIQIVAKNPEEAQQLGGGYKK